MEKAMFFLAFVFVFGPSTIAQSQPSLGEALNAPELVWETGGDSNWFGQTDITYQDGPAAESNPIPSGTSILSTTLTGPGTLTFAWRMQAESPYDSLSVSSYSYGREYCDPTISSWQKKTVYLSSGECWLGWEHRNSSVYGSAGSAWIADVRLEPGGTAPFITEQPGNVSVFEGSPAKLTVKALGTPPFSYQWRRNGQPIPGKTLQYLDLRGIQLSEAGLYNVNVTNEFGSQISQAAELGVEPAPTDPCVVITDVAPWGSSNGYVEGMVYGLEPNDFFVNIIIEVHGTLWTKPYWSQPWTEIKTDRSWKSSITTGGSDAFATTIIALVLPKPWDLENNYPPLLSGQAELPQELLERAVASAVVKRSPRILQFSGYDWIVKSGRWGPGNNYFSHSPENVWVDEEGRLHLRITKNQGEWKCGEVILTKSLGYGTYRLYLDSSVNNPPKNVVVGGLFTWSNNPEFNYREIDGGEFGTWGEGPLAPDAQYVVQPYSSQGHRYRFYTRPGQTVHSFTWEQGKIRFKSVAGTDPNTPDPNDVIAEYTFDHPGEVPPPGDETPRINLWLYMKTLPEDFTEYELVVRRFEYIASE